MIQCKYQLSEIQACIRKKEYLGMYFTAFWPWINYLIRSVFRWAPKKKLNPWLRVLILLYNNQWFNNARTGMLDDVWLIFCVEGICLIETKTFFQQKNFSQKLSNMPATRSNVWTNKCYITMLERVARAWSNHCGQLEQTQTIQWTNQNWITCSRHSGKTRASKSRLVSVLFLIGWEGGARFFSESHKVTIQN